MKNEQRENLLQGDRGGEKWKKIIINNKKQQHHHQQQQKNSLAPAMKTGMEGVEVGAVDCAHHFCKLKQARTKGILWGWQHGGHDADLVRAAWEGDEDEEEAPMKWAEWQVVSEGMGDLDPFPKQLGYEWGEKW